VRHSGATRAAIELDFAEKTTVTITDDGVGVSSRLRPATSSGGLGIVGMRERLTQVAGTLDISADPKGGTRVRATVPSSEPAP
jgi:signal transduction histidine kinase